MHRIGAVLQIYQRNIEYDSLMRDFQFTTTGDNDMSDSIEWPGYIKTLIDRGKLTFWVPDALSEVEYCNEGSERIYTDRAIEVLSVL